MNNDYLTPKQILCMISINAIMWIPMMYQLSELDNTQVITETAHVYESSVSEPLVYVENTLDATEPVAEPEDDISQGLTDEEIDLIALVTMAEAEGEPEEGKRLVIDTILNRVDSNRFPDTIYDVIYQPKAFTSMWTSRVTRCYVREDIRQLVLEELESRTNDEVVFFHTDFYHSYGTSLFQVGKHYFSKY
jgi:N-acetylmuramoyl-L-alanine amidase